LTAKVNGIDMIDTCPVQTIATPSVINDFIDVYTMAAAANMASPAARVVGDVFL